MLEDTGDRTPTAMAALRRTGDLDGDDVLVTDAGECRDVERVRQEVPLGVTQIGAVEPEISLVEDAAEGEPPASSVGRALLLVTPAVQHRTVAAGEVGVAAPVARYGELGPRRVVGVEPDRVPAEIVVGMRRAPHTVELHRRDGNE